MTWRTILLSLVTFAVVISIALLDAIPQDPNYHVFAD